MAKRVVVESTKTGLQAELIVREHSKQDPDRTHEIQPSKALGDKLAKAIKKVLDAEASE